MWRVHSWRGWCWVLMLAAALCGCSALTPPRCPPALDDRCRPAYHALDEYNFIVNGAQLQYKFTDSGYFTLSCTNGVTLDEPALPRFDIELRVNRVEFACPLPADSYAAVLRALNVSAPDKLTLTGHTLRAERLAGLARLGTLVLTSVDFEPSARDLRHLTGLRRLRLDGTLITAPDLLLLPAGLQLLQLVGTSVGLVPAAALARLPDLTALLVVDEASVRTEPAGGLRALTVQSDAAAEVSLTLPLGLENVTITGWAPERPRAWGACAGLRALELRLARARLLPAGWLARCAALATLRVHGGAQLARLEAGVLRGAAALRRVALTSCALETLPAGLLDDAPELLELDLSNNRLLALPGGLFERSLRLSELVLSRNRLDSSALDSLVAVTSLSALSLHGNAALDACPTDRRGGADYVFQQKRSKLRDLKSLIELNLSYTNTSRLCEDWLQLPRLHRLGLEHTAITHLQSDELRFNTAARNVTVSLIDTNVTSLEFSRRDLETRAHGAHVRVRLSRPLDCDCGLYWAAVVLCRPETAEWLSVTDARCADRSALCEVPHDKLVCAAPPTAPCPEGCKCGVREDRAGRVLQLDCESSGLRAVPRLHDILAELATQGGGDYAVHLGLANNSIDALRPEDLPPELTSLDLRNNSLSVLGAGAARALLARPGRRVWLAGNPLHCGCRAAAALAAVHSGPAVFADRAAAACVGGPSLAAAALVPPPPCRAAAAAGLHAGGAAAAALTLAAAAAAAAALALALLRPELRLRAKRALRAWGLLPRAREADDGRVYDAFVSFAHADEAVVHELVSRLESGTSPLRLCVHYRDWVPGGWIPTQIAASVRVSRRTVAVVSAAFLRSAWARAEFREAYAAALRDVEPRLVVVLLEDPARLPLDAELRAYLSANTYVRWGDPWFWPKLRRALPVPRRETRGKSAPALVSGATASTDASVRSASTVSIDASSTDTSVRSAAAAPADGVSVVSVVSGATASTDASEGPDDPAAPDPRA